MELIITLFLFLALLKRPSNSLYCGLFAWTGDSNRKFNWQKFNLLGIYNDSRGGDSCGRSVGSIVEYGLKGESDYKDFITKNKEFPVREKVAIGHARKASFGYAVNEENAQPIVLEEDGESVFILAHNGTIHNIDDLKDKYFISGYGKSDSTILAEIIYKNGFSVLEEYIGAATLIIYDRRKYLETGDTVMYIFKGASKLRKYATQNYEERPLYSYTKNNSTYFSSLEESLWVIGAEATDTIDLDHNIVYTFRNGVLIEEESILINREEAYQENYTYGKGAYARNGYDGYSYEEYGGYGGNYNKRVAEEVFTTKRTEEYIDLNKEVFSNKAGRIDFRRGLFYNEDTPLNGIHHITLQGTIMPSKNKDTKPFYFINGIMIDNHEDFNKATRLAERSSFKPHSDDYKHLLLHCSKYPLYINTGDPKGGRFYYSDKTNGSRTLFEGDLQPIYSTNKYEVKRGLAVGKSYLTPKDVILPKRMFEEKEDMNPNTEFDTEIDTNNEMIESEAARVMSEVLTALSNAKSELAILGDTSMIKTLTENLDTIEDELFLNEEGYLYKSKLNLQVEWKDPF